MIAAASLSLTSTSPTRAGAVALLEVGDLGGVVVEGVVVDEDRVALDGAGDVGADAVRVGVHPRDLLAHGRGVVGEQDRVADRLAHLRLAVGADEGRDLGLDELGDGEDVAVQAVEAAGDLARHLDVAVVVLADRDDVALDAEDVGGLEHGVAEQAVGHLVLAGAAGHVLEAGDALEPGDGDEVLEERVELGDLGDRRLQVERRVLRVDAGRELVEDHRPGVGADLVDVGAGVLRRQHMQVGDDEERLVLVLQAHPVLDAADVVPEVQLAGGPVPGEHPLARGGGLAGHVGVHVGGHGRPGRLEGAGGHGGLLRCRLVGAPERTCAAGPRRSGHAEAALAGRLRGRAVVGGPPVRAATSGARRAAAVAGWWSRRRCYPRARLARG